MPVSPLDGPPFRGRNATALTRIVGTVRSVLDPDSVEMEYLFEPSGQRFRWRALRSRVFTAGTVRPARRHSAPAASLAVEFHLAGLLRGALDAASAGPGGRGRSRRSCASRSSGRFSPSSSRARRPPRSTRRPGAGSRARPKPRPRRSFSSGRRAPCSTRTAPPRRSSRPAARSSSFRETAARPRSRPGSRAWGRAPPPARSGAPSSPTAGRSKPRSRGSPTRRRTTSPFSR